MERLTRSILRNKTAGPIKRKAVKGYLVHRSEPLEAADLVLLQCRRSLTACRLRILASLHVWLSVAQVVCALCHLPVQHGRDVMHQLTHLGWMWQGP